MNAKNDPFPAHIRRTDKTEVRQSVSDHNRQTGQYAWDALAVVNLGGVAKLAGLLHDMGKYTARYRKYIEDAVSGVNPVVRGSVNYHFWRKAAVASGRHYSYLSWGPTWLGNQDAGGDRIWK